LRWSAAVDAGLFVFLAIEAQFDLVIAADAHAEYIRSIMSAQSLASVRPSRALIVRNRPGGHRLGPE